MAAQYTTREIFGPFLPIIPVDDIDEAIQVLNSKYVLVVCASKVLTIDVEYVIGQAHS